MIHLNTVDSINNANIFIPRTYITLLKYDSIQNSILSMKKIHHAMYRDGYKKIDKCLSGSKKHAR